MRTKRHLGILILIMVMFVSINALVSATEYYRIATATVTGTGYPTGIAQAQTFNEHFGEELDVHFTAISSAGAAENLVLFRNKEAELAIMQSNVPFWGYHGTHLYEGNPFKKLRTLYPISVNPYHFFVRDGINSLEDLRGKSFSVGAAASGTETSSKVVLEALGITYDDFKQEFLDHGASIDAVKNNLIDGCLITSTAPAPPIADAMIAPKRGYKLLSLSQEEIETITKAEPWLVPVTLPAHTYSNQPEPIHTVGHASFFCTTDDLSEEVAYKVTKTTWENLDELIQAMHIFNQMKLYEIVSVHNWFKNGLPIHRGALKYYREIGFVD